MSEEKNENDTHELNFADPPTEQGLYFAQTAVGETMDHLELILVTGKAPHLNVFALKGERVSPYQYNKITRIDVKTPELLPNRTKRTGLG